MMRLFIIVLLLTACSTISPLRSPLYHSSLASSDWKPLTPRQTPNAAPRADNRPAPSKPNDIRARMVAEAEALPTGGKDRGDYGADDLEMMLAKVNSQVKWHSNQGLDALVSLARTKGAHHLENDPIPGDIVLFHNQWDANMNGEADDWLTGCGVVVKRHGPRFEAVVRTGHAPRQVTVWPDGPARRMVDGEKTNSFLRVPSRSDSSDTAYLAGQLFAGYIDIEELAADSGR